MDGIIIASSPWTSPRLGFTQEVFCVNYTGVFNLLGKYAAILFPATTNDISDYPACTFPVTFADKSLDKARTFWKPLNEKDAALQADYDPEFYHGTPVVLQCVGRRMEDEKVLEMTGIIADALKMHS
jgi:amidase